MTSKGISFRWIRLILDCFLLVAVILVVLARIHPNQAGAGTQSFQQAIMAASPQSLAELSQAGQVDDTTQVITGSVQLDDNTLAALMAAENAALTPPQFMTGLPIVTR